MKSRKVYRVTFGSMVGKEECPNDSAVNVLAHDAEEAIVYARRLRADTKKIKYYIQSVEDLVTLD